MSSPDHDAFPAAFRRILSEEDVARNSTLQSFDALRDQLDRIERHRDTIDVVLDIGCGYGGFSSALAAHLGASTVYGIDIDEESREIASTRGVTTFDIDVESDPLPFDGDAVDLVVSFGLLEHLCYYDMLFEEVDRILADGFFWVTTPNLGGWNNRFALLTGHQPRNVEISIQCAAGTLPVYDDEFLDHVHAPTHGALLELLDHHGFTPVDSTGLTPYQRSRLVWLFDTLFGRRTSWARRIAVLARNSGSK